MARRTALVRETVMRVSVRSSLPRALALLAAPALAFTVLPTPAHSADVLYGAPPGAVYERFYESYEVRRFSHPAPAYAAPPYYGPPPRYLLERYAAPPPVYVAPRPYVARRYVHGTYPDAQPDPYPRGYIQVDRLTPPVIIPPRRGVRAYPYVVPQEGVVVETVRPYRWRWDEAPDPLF
jgi:hypothetical protein